MATTNAEPIFIDTNALIRANIATAPLHNEALAAVQGFESAGVSLWVSRQVLREYLATMSRPQPYTTNPIQTQILVAQVRAFESRFSVAEESPQVTTNLLSLMEKFQVGGKQVHDANIVAVMQAYNIKKLFTHNVTDFSRYASLISIIGLKP
jgi:predicted nucleic acid-binding protein